MGLFVNGFKRPRRISDFYIPPFWGDVSDGILTTGATYQAGVDFDKYSGFCIKQFSSINWDPDQATPETLTIDEPCRGLVLFVEGDVNIGEYATISMAKLGSVLPVNPENLIEMYGDSVQMHRIVNTLKTQKGGVGGDGGNGKGTHGGVGGPGGSGGDGRTCLGGRGAGGGGGAYDSGYTGKAGGSILNDYGYSIAGSPGTAGIDGGGGGGSGPNSNAGRHGYGAGGGGGNNGAGTAASYGEHSGGFMLIIAKGAITIAGKLDVSGGKGGNGATGDYGKGGGGGGAGGGVIAVFSRGAIDTTSAIKTLTGGAGGTGYQSGSAGGNGIYYEERI